MEYIIVLVASLILFCLSLKAKKRVLKIIFLTLAFILPCVLAGMRDYKVGSDVNMYVHPLFLKARGSNIFEFVFNNPFMNDYLYLFITYIVSNVTGSMFWLLFIIELLVIVPAYLSLARYHKKNSAIVVGMLIFYAITYNASFNMVRQSIALSFSFLALTYLLDKNKKKYLLYVIIATLFHWSALFSLIIVAINTILKSRKTNSKQKAILQIGIVYLSIALIFILPNISGLLSQIGLGETKVVSFINHFSASHFIGSSTADTLFFMYMLLLVIIFENSFKTNDDNYKLFKYLLIIGLITMQFGSFIKFGFRLSYFFLYPAVLFLIPKLADSRNKKGIMYGLSIAAAYSFYWYFWVIIANYHDTYPYLLAK